MPVPPPHADKRTPSDKIKAFILIFSLSDLFEWLPSIVKKVFCKWESLQKSNGLSFVVLLTELEILWIYSK